MRKDIYSGLPVAIHSLVSVYRFALSDLSTMQNLFSVQSLGFSGYLSIDLHHKSLSIVCVAIVITLVLFHRWIADRRLCARATFWTRYFF